MGASIRLGRVLGIPLGINYSWFIIFALVTFSLLYQFRLLYPAWSLPERWAVAVVTSLLFFGSVLAHELSHSVVAISRGIPVKGITLFVFGGAAQIGREAQTPGVELLIAVVGPFSSIVLGGAFWGLYLLLRPVSDHLAGIALVLAPINVALGVFNMIPGFPLDGGRVFRAVLWKVTRNYRRSTGIAIFAGQMVAALFILGGILIAVRSGSLQGLWLALIGWFLGSAAGATRRQAQLTEALQGSTARDLMAPDFPAVRSDASLTELVASSLLVPGRRFFLVVQDGRFQGVITLRMLRRVPQAQWPFTSVASAMLPRDQVRYVAPKEEALAVLEILEEAGLHQLPVIDEDMPVGLVTREGLLRRLRVRSELRI
ncbi:MAG: site-2 protease family protein [Dehalococcoidia bacterium]